MLFTGFNLCDLHLSLLIRQRAVRVDTIVHWGSTDTWGGSTSVVIKYRSIQPPGCLSFIMLDFLLKNAYGNLCELWPLAGLSCGTSDEVEHFICCVLTSKARGVGQCLLLAILMTSKFDIRPLAKASWLVARRLSPERLLPPAPFD